MRKQNVVVIALTASGISILSRETPNVTEPSDVQSREMRKQNVVAIALTASGISILSRETPNVTEQSNVKYAT